MCCCSLLQPSLQLPLPPCVPHAPGPHSQHSAPCPGSPQSPAQPPGSPAVCAQAYSTRQIQRGLSTHAHAAVWSGRHRLDHSPEWVIWLEALLVQQSPCVAAACCPHTCCCPAPLLLPTAMPRMLRCCQLLPHATAQLQHRHASLEVAKPAGPLLLPPVTTASLSQSPLLPACLSVSSWRNICCGRCTAAACYPAGAVPPAAPSYYFYCLPACLPHRDLLHESPLDAHCHGGEAAGAGPTRTRQLQPHHQPVNLDKLHIASISHEVGADLPGRQGKEAAAVG